MAEGTSVWLLVALVPLVLALATAFTKASVVLGALRVGLSAEALLPLPVILAVALLVTGLVMAPTVSETLAGWPADGGATPWWEGGPTAWWARAEPLRDFLRRHASTGELTFFAELQGSTPDDPLVLVSAFLATELTEALSMAVLILVPLVLLDLLVAQALVLLGLANQPPTAVVLPLKLLLFLSVGGWDVVLGGLVEGYR